MISAGINPYISIAILGSTVKGTIINKWKYKRCGLPGAYARRYNLQTDQVICNLWDVKPNINNGARIFPSDIDICLLVCEDTMSLEGFIGFLKQKQSIARGSKQLVVDITHNPSSPIHKYCDQQDIPYICLALNSDKLTTLLDKIVSGIYRERKEKEN
jgi:hypothetical protein